jgi:cell division septum initiation protein DivIVA
MKRTVSINIKGMNFLIEEDAYELLQQYIDRLTHVLRNDKGSKEIIEDIELRVAELCSSKLNDRKQVIEITW